MAEKPTYEALVQRVKALEQAEKTLLENEGRFRLIFHTSPDAINLNKASDGMYIDINDGFTNIMGYTREDCIGKTSISFNIWKNLEDRKRLIDGLAEIGYLENMEAEFVRKDGQIRVGLMSARTLRINDEYVVLSITRDITKLKKAETALRESEEKYRTVLEANPDPVIVYDMEGIVTYFNPAFSRIFGWSLVERLGKKMDVFVPDGEWDKTKMMVDKVLAGKRFSGIETCRYNKNGDLIPVSISGAVYKDQAGNPIGSIINLRNISKQKKMEAQLQRAQKMEAIGTLAGGIAHDFNNILTAILGYSELALSELPSKGSIRNKLKAIHASGERARDLVTQILAFSRIDEQARSPVQIYQILKDALKLLRPAIPTTIDIQTKITSKCHILGDPSRIHQIIMNLCTNAYQAMLKTGGTLRILLSKVKLKGKTAALAQVPAGTYGKLVISDTGVGISPENIDRVFDPYFTTKEKGKGTGLGLAVVHGIVKSHGGAILVESQMGKGTRFEVYLPLTLNRNHIEKQTDAPILGGKERILLVDDEHFILEIEKEMLKKQGYVITAKDDVLEAMALFAEKPEAFDLVITDMTMPKMTGDKFAGELSKIRSDIPIILCTGFSELISEEKAASLGIKGFLMKPVTMKHLSDMIRKVLDAKENATED